jgi:hypothetical protein
MIPLVYLYIIPRNVCPKPYLLIPLVLKILPYSAYKKSKKPCIILDSKSC